MATGVGMGFDLSKLEKQFEKLDKQLEKLMKDGKTFEQNMNNIFNNMGQQGLSNFALQLNSLRKNIVDFGKQKVGIKWDSQSLQKYIDDVNRLIYVTKYVQKETKKQGIKGVSINGLRKEVKEAQELLRLVKQAEKSAASTTKNRQQTFAGSLRFSSNVKTLEQERKAIQNLEAAREKLKKTDVDYQNKLNQLNSRILQHNRNIENATRGARDLKEKHHSLMNTSEQLARKLALVFSVSQIQGYVNKLIQVRGEFELQQKALQAILQDADKANQIWDKTVALAVKSPYRVKELVTYTKQLAAYRIESDKLYDTTKRLADISSGLGVDMQRIILAYGQVKAANYLRGTELRQFSEAGINMLGELSKYFTEIEGRAVSIGDVFDRISKRMVTFEDVDKIFSRITSEGGVFYQMQEKQANTLHGMRMNLQDSVDLMMNDIGKAHEDKLKGSIKIVRELVNNWRDLEPIIVTAGVALLTYMGTGVLKGIYRYSVMILNTWRAHPFIAIASVLALVTTAIVSAVNATSELAAVMNDVDKNVTEGLNESISVYHKLADTIRDTTKSNEERNKALDTLKQKYKQILPDQYTELQQILAMKDSYKDATEAMLSYYNDKAKAQKRDKIEQLYQEEIYQIDTPELIESIKQTVKATRLGMDERLTTIYEGAVSGVVGGVIEDLKSGLIENSYSAIVQEIIERLETYAGVAFPKNKRTTNLWAQVHDIHDIISTIKNYRQAIESIQGLPFGTYDEEVASNAKQAQEENIKQAQSAFENAKRLYGDYANTIGSNSDEIQKKRIQIEEDVKKILTDLPESMAAYKTYLTSIFGELETEAKKGVFAYQSAIQTIESKLYSTRTKDGNGKDVITGGLAKIAFDNIEIAKTSNKAAQTLVSNFQEELDVKGKQMELTSFQKAVIEGARQIADKFGTSVDIFAKFVPKQKDALSTIRKNVEGEIESIEQQIKEYQASMATGLFVLSTDVLNQTQENIDSLKAQLPALKEYYKFLGGALKNTNGNGGRSNSLYDERIKVIDDMHKKFEELNKKFSKDESVIGAFDAYKDAFEKAFEGIGWIPKNVSKMTPQEFVSRVLNFPDEDALVDFLDKLAKEPMKAFEKIKVELAKGEYVYDMKVNAKEENDQKLIESIEDLFSGYELSLELEKLNIPPSLAKQLFGINSMKLEDLRPAALKKFGLGDMVDSTDHEILDSEAYKNMSTTMQKEVKETLDKISEMEDKQRVENLKKYVAYLTKAQSEHIRIKLEEASQLEEINNLPINDEVKQTMREGVRKETEEKLDRAEWEDFKDSGMYIRLFDDLDAASTRALQRMRDKLSELSNSLDDLSPEQLKTLYEQIEKVDEKLSKRKALKNIFSVKSVREYVKAVKDSKKADDELLRLNEKELQIKEALVEINSQLEGLKKRKEQGQDVDSDIKDLEEEKKQKEEDLANNKKQTKETEKQQQNSDQTKKNFKSSASEVGYYISAVAEALPQLAGDMESIFGSMDDSTKDLVDSISDIAGGIGNAMQGFAKGDYIQGVLGVTQAIAGVFEIGDKKRERQIKREQEYVRRLQREYEKLAKKIDVAYSIDTLETTTKLSKQNIEDQIAATERMITAENDKKKKDKEKIQQWREEIEDMKEQLKELEEQRIEALGGLGSEENYKSAAESFVDAWLEAFKECGDGIKGLDEEFEKLIENLMKKQLLMRFAQGFLDNIYKKIDSAFPEDGTLSARRMTQILQEASDMYNSQKQEFSNTMAAFAQMLDVTGTLFNGSELSGLQKGIQGITESQADILASYWNSVRAYSANIDKNLTTFVKDFKDMNVDFNPILTELRGMSFILENIETMLSSVIGVGNSTHNGHYIKVLM